MKIECIQYPRTNHKFTGKNEQINMITTSQGYSQMTQRFRNSMAH